MTGALSPVFGRFLSRIAVLGEYRRIAVFKYGGRAPVGRLLAEGIPMESARELGTKRNWRLRAVIPALRAARDHLVTVEMRCLARRDQHTLRVFRRRLDALEWALRELLLQRARVRRNRGRQMTMDFSEATTVSAVDNPRHSSETFEHGTPPEVVEAARVVLGAIDLDPASCDKANGYIRAVEYMTREDNGFLQPWWGRVFLNPPGGLMELDTGRPVFIRTKKRPPCTESGACGLPPGHVHKNVGSSAAAWWKKLAREFASSRVTSAIFVGFSLELLQTTQTDDADLPLPLDFPICYPRKRLDYIALEKDGIVPGGAPTHASFVVLLTRAIRDAAPRYAFRNSFGVFGKVVDS